MKRNKFLRAILYITVFLLISVILVAAFYTIQENNKYSLDNLGLYFLGGFSFFLSFVGAYFSPLAIIIIVINQLFFNKEEKQIFTYTLILNIIFIAITLYTASHSLDGLNMI